MNTWMRVVRFARHIEILGLYLIARNLTVKPKKFYLYNDVNLHKVGQIQLNLADCMKKPLLNDMVNVHVAITIPLL